MPKLADINHCSGCLSCVESCPTNALYSQWNEEGHLTYGINNEACINCLKCEKNCPAINGYHYGENNLCISNPYSAWCRDEEVRSNSTTGGVFAALAKEVIFRGGVVVGACMKDSVIKHKVITSVDELHFLQGSKYAQSDTTGVFREVLNYLKQDKIVLFSGLGCQVAGLLNFLPKNRQYDNLYTLDLICGGVPSRSLITKYLEHEGEKVKEIASFRNKNVYQFYIINSDGEKKLVPLSQRPLPLCGFYTELTNKYICYDCQYVGAHRNSDITIGDYWGDTEFISEHKKGLSIAVVHSKKMDKLIHQANLELHPVNWNQFLLHNPRMVYGKNPKGESKIRRRLADAITHDSYEKFVIDYANGATPKQPLYYARKVLNYLIGKMKPSKKMAYVKHLLIEENKL